MKLKVCALAAAIAASTLPAQADMLLGGRVGMDLMFVETDGELSSDSSGWRNKERISVYGAIEHFIPLVPNVMVRYNALDTQNPSREVDLTNTDFILYYEILDNPGVELDLGLNYREYIGEAGTIAAPKSLDKGLLMAYANARIDLVGTGFYGFGNINMTNYDDRQISDYQLGLGYGFDILWTDLNVRAGYRAHDFDVNGFDGITADIQQEGWFLGVELDF